MAIQPVQPGTAPANPCTHEDAATYLQNYALYAECRPFGIDPAPGILNELYGLCHILATAFEEANRADGRSELLAINPILLADGFRSIKTLTALAAFFAEAR